MVIAQYVVDINSFAWHYTTLSEANISVAENSSLAAFYHETLNTPGQATKLCDIVFQLPNISTIKAATMLFPLNNASKETPTMPDPSMDRLIVTKVNDDFKEIPEFGAGKAEYEPLFGTTLLATPNIRRNNFQDGVGAIQIYYQCKNGIVVAASRELDSGKFLSGWIIPLMSPYPLPDDFLDEEIGNAILRSPIAYTARYMSRENLTREYTLYTLTSPTTIQSWIGHLVTEKITDLGYGIPIASKDLDDDHLPFVWERGPEVPYDREEQPG